MVVDFRNLNTSQVTDIGSTFYECRNLQTLYLSNFDTSTVKIWDGCLATAKAFKH